QPKERDQRGLGRRIELDATPSMVGGKAGQEEQPQEEERDAEGADVDPPPQRLADRQPGQCADGAHHCASSSDWITVRTKKSSRLSRCGTIACSRAPCCT